MNLGNRRDWREICRELLRENDPERSRAIMEKLLEELDNRAEGIEDRRND